MTQVALKTGTSTDIYVECLAGNRSAGIGNQISHAMLFKALKYSLFICFGHLDNSARLFGKQTCAKFIGIMPESILECEFKPATRRECHLAKGGNQTAIRPVMVGKYLPGGHKLLNSCKESCQVAGIIQVRNLIAEYPMDLLQDGAAQTVLSTPQVNQQKTIGLISNFQLRGNCKAGVGGRCESCHYQ